MSSTGFQEAVRPEPTWQVGLVVRAPLLVLCLVLAAFDTSGYPVALATGVLAAAGSAGAALPQGGRVGQLARFGEAVVWGVCVVATGTSESALLPYLLAPAFVGGLVDAPRTAIVVPGLGAATLLLGNVLYVDGPVLADFVVAAAEWVILSVAIAAVGAYVRHQQQTPRDEPLAAQEAAHRLLVQLRVVARRLPGTLSPAATAESLLLGLRNDLRVDRGVVLVRGEGQQLVPLAQVGDQTLDWNLDLHGDSGIAEAWAAQVPVVKYRQHLRSYGSSPSGSSLALPLALGRRSFGVVAVECDEASAYDGPIVEAALASTKEVALALDTGLLFDEIRAVATVEERQRLAREIHDGVAQELAHLGYAIDNVTAGVPDASVRAPLQELRAEVTRVMRDLRMSLFDLRSAVDPQAGLGTALSEHVRSVGARSGLTVHLSLKERALRLPPSAEAELLRIAQEAIANARKHGEAGNLWVSCEVDPPSALLVVEDDGVGITRGPADDSYGLKIMQERAVRIGGVLTVDDRPDGEGTRVSVRLGRFIHGG